MPALEPAVYEPQVTAVNRIKRSSLQRDCSAELAVTHRGQTSGRVCARELGIEKLGLRAWEEMPIAIQRDGDRGMPHERGDGLCLDPGGDHQRSKSVTSVVQRDRSKLRLVLPDAGRSANGRVGGERNRCRAAEDKTPLPAEPQCVFVELVAKYRWDSLGRWARTAMPAQSHLQSRPRA